MNDFVPYENVLPTFCPLHCNNLNGIGVGWGIMKVLLRPMKYCGQPIERSGKHCMWQYLFVSYEITRQRHSEKYSLSDIVKILSKSVRYSDLLLNGKRYKNPFQHKTEETYIILLNFIRKSPYNDNHHEHVVK